MATKKQNKRYTVRKARRALNRHPETLTQLSGRRCNVHGWSGGLDHTTLRMRAEESGKVEES